MQLGIGDEASEEEEGKEDCIDFEKHNWKSAGMTPTREPNERYEDGAKDNLRVGMVPAGLVGAARGGGGGGEGVERNFGREGGRGRVWGRRGPPARTK